MLLDLVLGDPAFRWHPVRLMGSVIAWVEMRWRTKVSGVLLALGLPLGSAAIGWALLRFAGGFGAEARWWTSALLIYFCVACRDMLAHAGAVLLALRRDDLETARLKVAMIVGRDAAQLDRQGILRACVESVAESACDGLVAPLFFAYLGGAPLALAYKALSTLDSMIGHKNERFALFGWASARGDDLANLIPARITAALASMLAPLAGGNARAGLLCAWRDAPGQPSPNSGWPEGAFAGALGVRLGGPVLYGGIPSEKNFLGTSLRPLSLTVGVQACVLFLWVGLATVVLGEGILLALG
ncbi:MAG: adenosylcobinamide-phosphate synthase CbiB [candidate division FCPU426 bacterium]